VAQVPTTVEALTGVDLVKTIQTLPGIGRAKAPEETEQ
jgi:hypothetical protein